MSAGRWYCALRARVLRGFAASRAENLGLTLKHWKTPTPEPNCAAGVTVSFAGSAVTRGAGALTLMCCTIAGVKKGGRRLEV
jgi:hypothetical protein